MFRHKSEGVGGLCEGGGHLVRCFLSNDVRRLTRSSVSHLIVAATRGGMLTSLAEMSRPLTAGTCQGQ